MKPIYLDYAATSPLDERVLEAMQPYLLGEFYNPSATYLAAKKVRKDLEEARAKAAAVLGARPAEIVVTAGATEANNLALFGVAAKFPGAEIISTAIEHDSVLEPLRELEKRGHNVTLINPSAQGLVDAKEIAKSVNDKTVLVSVMYANNEVGTIQPIRQISEELAAIRRARQTRGVDLPLYFHTDAAQAGNYLDLHAKRLGVDLMSVNGSKVYGPKQTGLLFVNAQVQIEPLIFGGGQERGLRSGTENVAGYVGLATALELAHSMRHAESERLSQLQKLFFELLESKVPGVEINGSLKHRLPNNVHVTIAGQDNERLLMELDERGILAAAGSACSASEEEPSHVLKAMGIGEQEAQSSLRFTMGRQTTDRDIRKTVEILASLA